MRFLSLALVLALGTGSAAVNADGPEPAIQETSKPKKEKKICRNIDTTGSRVGPRVCKTRSAWGAKPDGELGSEAQNKSQPN